MEAKKMDSSAKSRIAWSSQHPREVFCEMIISRCYFFGRKILPLVILIFMTTYWAYAVAVYN